MTKTNCKGRCIRIPIWLGEGGPLVREPVSVLAGTPRGGWAHSSRAHKPIFVSVAYLQY